MGGDSALGGEVAGRGLGLVGRMPRVVVHAYPRSVDAAAEPLGAEERRLLERSSLELRAALRAWLAGLPVAAQTASGLSRFLGVERTTCQRLVSAVTAGGSGLELPSRLPGVQGIRQVLASERAGVGEDVGGAISAVDRYEEVVRRLGGSRSRLLRRLEAAEGVGEVGVDRGGNGGGGGVGGVGGGAAEVVVGNGVGGRAGVGVGGGVGGGEAVRRSLFESAALLTGRWSELWLAAHVFSPHPERSDVWVQARSHGLVGHHASGGAVPLTFHVIGNTSGRGGEVVDGEVGRFVPLVGGGSEVVDGDGLVDVPLELLRGFSSDPPPVVRSRSSGKAGNEFVVQAIEVEGEEDGGVGGGVGGRGVDLMFGLRGLSAAAGGGGGAEAGGMEEVWGLVNFPVRRMVMDVFLHRDLARACLPGLDVHLWRPDFAQQSGERWQTRFGESPRLELVGPPTDGGGGAGGVVGGGGGFGRAKTDAWRRYTELLGLMFAYAGVDGGSVDASQYVGYRCDVRFPIWRAGYRMTFDFGV